MSRREAASRRRSRSGPEGQDSNGYSIDQVRAGLPVSELDALARELRIDRARLAALLGTTVRTLQRRSESGERLGASPSDRLARVRRIHALAVHVFGERSKASDWLTSRSRSLNGEVPLSLLDTDIGAQQVQQELRQIEFGMPF